MPVIDPSSVENEISNEDARLIRNHLEEIVASTAFFGSKRSQEFLQLIVEHALEGRLDSLRERMIGVEMFGRPVAYNTAEDAVVRVKATEVRKKLAQFYSQAISTPPIRIEIPVGSYVPKFYLESTDSMSGTPSLAAESDAPLWKRVGHKESNQSSAPGAVSRLKTYLFAVSLLGFIGFALFAYWQFKQSKRKSNLEPDVHSIAVLPLQNLSVDAQQDYFADGMTEELISLLGQMAPVRVISRTSTMTYKGTAKTLPTIARELGVDAVVEGSVQREGKQVRISVQLIDARTDRQLWAHTYDRDLTSVLVLQGEVAQSIVDEISVNVATGKHAGLARSRPIFAAAQDLYLQGLYHLNQGDPRSALGFLEDSINKDPDYAPAHAALADCYGWLGEAGWRAYSEVFPKQRAEASRAIELDETLPEGHVELGNSMVNISWDWINSEKEFRRALELNPNSVSAHRRYGVYLRRLGRIPESILQATLELRLDPASSRAFTNSAFAYYSARQYDRGLEQVRRASTLDPDARELLFPLGALYAEKGLYKESVVEFQKIGDKPHALGHMGNSYARAGELSEAHETITKLEEHIRTEGVGSYEVALVYAGLGDRDDAFAWLNKAYEVHDVGLTNLLIDPCLDPLRSDPRFHELLRRVGFPS